MQMEWNAIELALRQSQHVWKKVERPVARLKVKPEILAS
jgi:hypothetical protein